MITASSTSAARSSGISCSISAVLPEPTGPPMPTRADACAVPRSLIAACSVCASGTALRRLAGDRARRRPNLEGLRVDRDLRAGVVVQHVALAELARSARRQQRLREAERPARRASIAAAARSSRDSACLARPNAPHCGRIASGSQVISEASLSPIARPGDEAALEHHLRLDAEEGRPPQHDVGELARLERADVASMPKVRAALMVYLAM